MSGAVNRNGRRNGSYYHSVGTGYGIENENENVVVADGDDHYLPFHCHDVNSVGGGKDECHRGRLNKRAPWVSVARNGVSEKMLVKKGSHLTIDMMIEDERYVR